MPARARPAARTGIAGERGGKRRVDLRDVVDVAAGAGHLSGLRLPKATRVELQRNTYGARSAF